MRKWYSSSLIYTQSLKTSLSLQSYTAATPYPSSLPSQGRSIFAAYYIIFFLGFLWCSTGGGHTLALGARVLLVGGDVVVELLLLLGDLCRGVLAVLRRVDLQVQYLKIKLEQLVQGLADLQGGEVVALCGFEGIVEAPRADLGVLGGFARVLEDLDVGCVNVFEVAPVDLNGGGSARVFLS